MTATALSPSEKSLQKGKKNPTLQRGMNGLVALNKGQHKDLKLSQSNYQLEEKNDKRLHSPFSLIYTGDSH